MGEISRGGLPDLDPKIEIRIFKPPRHIEIIRIGEPGPPRLVGIKVQIFKINRDETSRGKVEEKSRKSRNVEIS